MRQIGEYCKAFPIVRFRAFPQWTENIANLRKRTEQADSAEVEAAGELTDDSFLYLQQNYNVTDGIFVDENVIFDKVTPEWIDFCKETLQLVIPDYTPADADADQAAPANGNGHAA